MSLADEERWQGAEIAKARALPRSMLRRRQATVTAVSAPDVNPRTVTLVFDSAPIPGVRVPASYWPVVGDVVYTVKHHGDDLVIGPLSTQAMDPYDALTLVNSWVDYGAPHAGAGAYRDASGLVRCRGVIKSGTMTAGTTVATLAAGLRPRYTEIMAAIGGAALVRLDIAADGTLKIPVTIAANNYLSLSGLSWHAYA